MGHAACLPRLASGKMLCFLQQARHSHQSCSKMKKTHRGTSQKIIQSSNVTLGSGGSHKTLGTDFNTPNCPLGGKPTLSKNAAGLSPGLAGVFLQPHAYVESRAADYINCTFSMNTFSGIKVLILPCVKPLSTCL